MHTYQRKTNRDAIRAQSTQCPTTHRKKCVAEPHTMTNALTDACKHDNNVYIGNGGHNAQGWGAPVMPHVVHDA